MKKLKSLSGKHSSGSIKHKLKDSFAAKSVLLKLLSISASVTANAQNTQRGHV